MLLLLLLVVCTRQAPPCPSSGDLSLLLLLFSSCVHLAALGRHQTPLPTTSWLDLYSWKAPFQVAMMTGKIFFTRTHRKMFFLTTQFRSPMKGMDFTVSCVLPCYHLHEGCFLCVIAPHLLCSLIHTKLRVYLFQVGSFFAIYRQQNVAYFYFGFEEYSFLILYVIRLLVSLLSDN